MEIKILGVGCSKCDKLEKNLNQALKELNIDTNVEKVADLKEIVAYGVMIPPALVIDDEVKTVGKIPKVKEIKKYFS